MLKLDNREGDTTLETFKARFRESVLVEKLYCADIAMEDQDGHLLTIELKTWSDLLSSMRKTKEYPEGRLRRQVERMYHESTDQMLMIYGWHGISPSGHVQTAGKSQGWSYWAAFSILQAIQQAGDIVVVQACNLEGVIEIVRGLHERSLEGCIRQGLYKTREKRRQWKKATETDS